MVKFLSFKQSNPMVAGYTMRFASLMLSDREYSLKDHVSTSSLPFVVIRRASTAEAAFTPMASASTQVEVFFYGSNLSESLGAMDPVLNGWLAWKPRSFDGIVMLASGVLLINESM
jgi:hypothetical protein